MKNINSFNLGIVFFMATTHSAFACMGTGEPGLFEPLLVMALAVTLFSILFFYFVSWLIRRMFFRGLGRWPVVSLTAFLFSIVLGIFGTFMVPKFEYIIRSFVGETSVHANFVFTFNDYLWLPAFLILVLWFSIKNSLERNRYFAAVLFVEACLLVFLLSTLYSAGSSCG